MAAITWRNVDAPDNRGAAALLQGAQNSINMGFDKFGEIIKQREAGIAAQEVKQKADNTEALYSAISQQFNTPEKYQAGLESGEIAGLATSFGDVDKAGARRFMSQQLTTLQNQARTSGEYADYSRDRTEQPDRELIAADIAQRRFAEARQKLETGTLRNESALYKAIDAGQQQDVERGYKAADAEHLTKTRPLDLANKRAQNNALSAAAAERTGTAGVKGFFGETVRNYTQAQAAYNGQVTRLATDLAIPVDKAGVPDFTRATPEVMGQFKTALKDIAPPPSSSATQAAFEQRLIDAKVPAGQILTLRKQFGELIGDGQVVSNADASAIKAAGERIDKRKVAAAKNNMFYTPNDELIGAKTSVIKSLDSIKDGEFSTKGTIRAAVADWMDGGFPLTNSSTGTVEKVAVPPKLMEYALALGKENDTVVWNSTKGNVQEKLTELLTSPEYSKLRAEADNLHNGTDVISKKQVMDSFLNVPGIAPSTGEAVKRLDAALASRQGNGTGPVPEKKNSEVSAPTLSVPIASNVGKAPNKVLDSQTLAFTPGQPPAPVAPIEVSKKALGKPTQVVTAYPGAIPKGQGQKLVATFIDDGDTARFKPDGAPGFTCRFDSIDSPETAKPQYGKPGQAFGNESKKILQDMITNKEVNVLVTGKDKKNRNLCQIEIEGKGVDVELVKAGAAWLYDEYVAPNNPRRAALSQAQESAKKNRVGLFADKYPEYPELFRRRVNK